MSFSDIMDIGVFGVLTNNTHTLVFWIIGFILCAVAGYFLGCLNFGIIISKYIYHDDVRQYGSGNAGSTNMMRTYGKKASALTFAGDGLKAIVSVLVGYLLAGYSGGFVAALFCVVGHAFPCFYGFKGGKGVASTAFAVLVLSPKTFFVLILLFIAIVLFTKYISLGSIMCMVVYPMVLYRLSMNQLDAISLIAAILTSALVIFLHRENIVRLWHGEENKFSFKKSEKKKKGAKTEEAAADEAAGSDENKSDNNG